MRIVKLLLLFVLCVIFYGSIALDTTNRDFGRRLYMSDEEYPVQMRKPTDQGMFQQVEGIKQSEFKKPYKTKPDDPIEPYDYGEMEYWFPAPVGFDTPYYDVFFDMPDQPWVSYNIPDVNDFPEGDGTVSTVYRATAPDGYWCDGEEVCFNIVATQPIYDIRPFFSTYATSWSGKEYFCITADGGSIPGNNDLELIVEFRDENNQAYLDQVFIPWGDDLCEEAVTVMCNWTSGANTLITIFKSDVNENEIGVGTSLAETDRVFTQNGGVAGASGGYRYLDGNDDYFTVTQNLGDNFFLNQNEFFIVFKLKDWNVPANTVEYILAFIADAQNELWVRRGHLVTPAPADYVDFRYKGNNVNGHVRLLDLDGDEIPPLTGAFYLYLLKNANNTYMGWDTVERCNWADIPATRKDSTAQNAAIVNSPTTRIIGTVGTSNANVYISYMIMSNTILFGDL